MSLVPHRIVLVALAGVAVLPGAHAARPMVVDDARVVDPKACQVESWVRDNQDGSREYWALPACNFTGHFELTAGGARTRDPLSGVATSDLVLQAKGLFRALPEHGWGAGWVVGNVRHPSAPGEGGGPYAYGMFSTSSFAGRLVTHANLGATRDTVQGEARLTWGFGTEIGVVGTRLQLLGEVFGVRGERPFSQVGFRWWVIPDRLQLDATWGDRWTRASSGERFLTIGLRVITPAFLP